MNEELLQFIWRYRYFNQSDLQTFSGNFLRIEYSGLLNTNQGPDFLDAKIYIDEILLAGSVELHLKSSDWLRHRHSNDIRYSNVILHVVWEHDGTTIPFVQVLELKGRVARSMLEIYHKLMIKEIQLPCIPMLHHVDEIIWTSWKERLVANRLEYRIADITKRIMHCSGSLEEAFWQTLARSWGMPLNADMFESMASSLPVSLLSRHRYRFHQVEALLFGQAGLLNEEFSNPYPIMLKKEYLFLKGKYNLNHVDGSLRFLRMRPPEFPTIRLAQLAMLIHQSGFFVSEIKEMESVNDIVNLLQVTANDFWHNHYTFKQESVHIPKKVGKETIQRVMINAVIPFLFYCAKEERNEKLRQRVIGWLFELPPEKNRYITEWSRAGVGSQHAFDTQSLLELRKNFCEQKRCLECALGNALLNV
jgi:hypothetical protein